jgi:hypothetical protein
MEPQSNGNGTSLFIHYTLNTGKSEESKRCSDSKTDQLLPLVNTGGPVPGRRGFRVDVVHGDGSALFSVRQGHNPVVSCGLAWNPDGARKIWGVLEKQYLDVSDALIPQLLNRDHGALIAANPEMPATLPWLTVLFYPMKATAAPDIKWLPEFESLLAWAILRERVEHPLSDSRCAELFQDAHRAGAAGKIDATERILRRLVLHRPTNSEFTLGLGRTLRELGRNDEAMTVLQRAETLNPQDRMTQCELGAALIAAKRFSEAEQRYLKALSMPARSIDHPQLTDYAQNGLAYCRRMLS